MDGPYRDKHVEPCPFCGEKRMFESITTEHAGRPSGFRFQAKFQCLGCGCTMPSNGYFWDRDGAIDNALGRWNRRFKNG